MLACDDEPSALELVTVGGGDAGSTTSPSSWPRRCSLDDAAAHLEAHGIEHHAVDGGLAVTDPEGNEIHLLAHRAPADPRPPHARPPSAAPLGHPRKLGHVNFLTGDLGSRCASTATCSG